MANKIRKMGKKGKWKRVAHNERKRLSFQSRYKMTNSEWTDFKRQKRKEGNGIQIDKIVKKARR